MRGSRRQRPIAVDDRSHRFGGIAIGLEQLRESQRAEPQPAALQPLPSVEIPRDRIATRHRHYLSVACLG